MKQLMGILLLLISLPAFSQSFDLYVMAGPVVSQIDGDRLGGYNKVGAIAGLGISRTIIPQWKALMELNYIQKGKGSYNVENGETHKTILNYVELPLVAEYQINELLCVQAGLSGALLISHTFLEDGEINQAPLYEPNRFDFDYQLGACYQLNEQMSVVLRLAGSIIAMGDQLPDVSYSPSIWVNAGGKYNRSIALSLRYMIQD